MGHHIPFDKHRAYKASNLRVWHPDGTPPGFYVSPNQFEQGEFTGTVNEEEKRKAMILAGFAGLAGILFIVVLYLLPQDNP